MFRDQLVKLNISGKPSIHSQDCADILSRSWGDWRCLPALPLMVKTEELEHELPDKTWNLSFLYRHSQINKNTIFTESIVNLLL